MNLTKENASRIERQSFTFVVRFSASSSILKVDLNPVESGASSFFGPSLVNFANLYQQFRFTELEVTAYPHHELAAANGNVSTTLVMGYNPMTAASAPASISEIAALSESACQVTGVTMPVKLRLNRKMLLRGAAVKWFHCDTTPDPDTAVQGQLIYAYAGTNSTTLVATWIVKTTIECRGPVAFGEFAKRFAALGPLLCPDSKSSEDDAKADELQPAPQSLVARKEVAVRDLSNDPNATVFVMEDTSPAPVSFFMGQRRPAVSMSKSAAGKKPPSA